MFTTLFSNANFAKALVTHSGKWSCFLLHGCAGWMTGRGHCPLWNVLRLSRGIFLQAFRKLLLPNILPTFDTFTWNRTLYADLHAHSAQLITQISKLAHRVDRVLGLYRRQNWDSPTHSPAASLFPPPLVGGGGDTRLRKRGWVVPILTRGQTMWYSRYICTLWERTFTDRMLKMWNPERLDHWIDFKYIDKNGQIYGSK